MSESVPVKAVKQTFEIVEELRDRGKAGTTELATSLDLPTSTIHDHLNTLYNGQYVTKSNGQYRLSTRFLHYGDITRHNMQIFRSSEEELASLAQETGEFVSLTIEEHGWGVVLKNVAGSDAPNFTTYPGMRINLASTAAGKTILASFSDEKILEIMNRYGYPKSTSRSLDSRSALMDEISAIREQAYALDRQESISGVRGVGVPLYDRNDSILGGISVYGPKSRISDEEFEEELPKRLHESANIIEVDYNFNRDGGQP